MLLSAIGSLQFDQGLLSRPELRVRVDFYDEYFKPLENTPCYAIMPVLIHPKSKGFLKLRSADPLDPPKLYGNFFTDREGDDMKTMISGIRFIQKLSNTVAFGKLNARIYDKVMPGEYMFLKSYV